MHGSLRASLPKLLILGGTQEARALAKKLIEQAVPVAVITSLAGRTDKPRPLAGQVRRGGFGGTDGLKHYLQAEDITAVIDATHPFAAQMSQQAFTACTDLHMPRLRLERGSWQEETPALSEFLKPSLACIAADLPASARVFLAIGRQDLAAFTGQRSCWFLMRSLSRPAFPQGVQGKCLVQGPGRTLYAEMALLQAHRISVLVTKDSGGPDHKIQAALRLKIPIMIAQRPPPPPGLGVRKVAAALDWIIRLLAQEQTSLSNHQHAL